MKIVKEILDTLKEHSKALNAHTAALNILAEHLEQTRRDENKRYADLER